MRYVRFLKTPRIEDKDPANSLISCLITITSDLGDSFLPYDLPLVVELRSVTGQEKIYAQKKVVWAGGKRSLAITLPLSRIRVVWPARIHVGMHDKSSLDDYHRLIEDEKVGVLSAWSGSLDPPKGVKEAVKLVERRIRPTAEARPVPELRIWEETGESIARHLWDAGIALSCHLSSLLERKVEDDAFAKIIQLPEGKRILRVLELGTGCGIVGISLAQAIHEIDVILTDLPEAKDIVSTNIGPTGLSSLTFQTLEWDKDLPKLPNYGVECPHCTELDLIVAADCTYNPDSSPALVNTISRLVHTSPQAAVVIAMKVRHSDEEVFFGLMGDAGFKVASSKNLPLPGDEGPGEETVDVYLFKLSDSEKQPKAVPDESCYYFYPNLYSDW